jgi:rare lipoprotein A
LPNNLPNIGDRNALAAAGAAFSGQASWYGPKFHGRKCSDGSRFDMEKMTAAHRSLPFGTKLLVMNRATGASCVVSVNDRGPFIGNRVLDLSKGAARKLNMLGSGVAMVDCLIIGSAGSDN